MVPLLASACLAELHQPSTPVTLHGVLVVPDANALHSDPLMMRFPAQKVVDLLDTCQAELVLSPVVIGELRRQYFDEVADATQVITARLRKFGKHLNLAIEEVEAEVRHLGRRAHERWEARFGDLTAMPRVTLDTWPSVEHRDIVERELSRRRPFLGTSRGTIGHRDAIIWLGVVALAQARPEETIVFVTEDKGFLGKNGLHEDLLHDLDQAGVPRDQVKRVGTLHGVLLVLEEEVAARLEEGEHRRAWRLAAIQDAVIRTAREFALSLFAPTWNSRDGTLNDPIFDIALPSEIDEWTSLELVEAPSEISLKDGVPLGEGSSTCSFEATLQFGGFVPKAEWYMADGLPGVDLWDSDWNEEYVAIEVQRRLEFDAILEFGEDDEDVLLDEVTAVRFEIDSAH